MVRYAPGEEAEFLIGLHAALRGERAADDARALAELLRGGGEDVVIVWGERIGAAAAIIASIAEELGIGGREDAGLLEIPVATNGRGLREAGVLPGAGPGYSVLGRERAGRPAPEIAQGAADGEITAL